MSIAVIVLSPICAVAGFIFKLYVDKFTEHKINLREKKIKDVEYKLKEFYCPLYTNLNSQTIVTREFVHLKGNLIFELEKFVLESHKANQLIIQNHMVTVNPNKTIQKLLLEYNDHIIVYKLMMDMQSVSDTDSVTVLFLTKSVPYPKTLFILIETELNALRVELDKLHNSIV
jgi:hypothetical protein